MASTCCFAHHCIAASSWFAPAPHAATVRCKAPVKPVNGFASRSNMLRRKSEVLTTKLGHSGTSTVHMRMYGGGGRGPQVPVQDRALSILPYLVPLLDSLSFGLYVFQKVPIAGSLVLGPLYPIYQIYRGIPFLAFGVFLVLYVFVVRNTNVSRFVRFNTYQALILDIVLIFPQLLSGANLGSAVPASVVEVLSTTVFYAMSFAIGYAVVNNIKGDLPDQIPGISNSVRDQMGPL